MSDARDKLQAAIEEKKKRGPSISAPPSKPAPAKNQPPPSTNRSAANAAPAKPAKSKTSFLKKKKKKAKKKSAPKKGKAGGSSFGSVFGKLAKNFVDELKEATAEISPGQLLESARDGITSLGNMARSNAQEETPEPKTEETSGQEQPASASVAGPASSSPNGAPSVDSSAAEEEPKQFSAVKVQKAPPARRKRKSTPENEPVATEEPILAPDETKTTPVEVSETPVEAENAVSSVTAGEAESASEDANSETTETAPISPTQVKRAKEKKEPEPLAEDEAEEVGIVDKVSEPVAEPADPPETAQADPPIGDQEVVSEGEPEPTTADPAVAEPGAAESEESSSKKSPSKKQPKRASKQTVHVSKEEQLVRAFYSLHKILNSKIWNPIVTRSDSKPSTLFAPRQHFDKQWATPEFRDGLKAASRLASGFTFDPAGVEFEEIVIEAVKNYAFDPQNMIKPHTELITKAIGSQATEEVLELVKKNKVRKLLYSAGTRLGTFVPTIEILARIYIGLRKKEDIIPGDRLQIQEEVLMKYNKAPYTDDLGKKARNLSLNYFMDYLTEYGFKLYKDRMEQAPDGQNHVGAQKRRHGTIRDSCVNLAREWGSKVGVSSPAMMNLERRLMEMADNHLADLIGEVPEDEEDDE